MNFIRSMFLVVVSFLMFLFCLLIFFPLTKFHMFLMFFTLRKLLPKMSNAVI